MNIRRLVRIAGTMLIVAGVVMLVWALVVWRWQDPFTALYTQLEAAPARQALRPSGSTHYQPPQRQRSSDGKSSQLRCRPMRRSRAEARRYRLHSDEGEAIGRIRVPRLGLNMIFVNGTDHDSLTKGPGPRPPHVHARRGPARLHRRPPHDLPRAVRAHREAASGRPVTLELPYATFRYRVFRHRIVDANEMTVLQSHGREMVALQACHPRFFATQRYIAYARLVRVEPTRRIAPSRHPSTALAAAPLAAPQG